MSLQLKKENLRFDRVFNVDSFQGISFRIHRRA